MLLESRQNVIDAMLAIAGMLGGAAKNIGYYDKSINRAVRYFYNGKDDAGQFIDRMIKSIETEMRKAWYQGMRYNDLDPLKDMKPEWEDILADVIASELDHVLDFAAAIEKAAAEEQPIDGLLGRAQLWVNRYNEVVNLAKLTTRPKDRYIWQMGSTVEHCATCQGLHGKIATAEDWLVSGYRPQGRMLECGGWNCACTLEYTEESVTQEGSPKP